MAVDHSDGPEWWRTRTLGTDWDSMVSAAHQGRDQRDNLRGEMIAELLGACDVVQRGEDWTLRDCEQFSARLATLADLATRVRGSISREALLQ